MVIRAKLSESTFLNTCYDLLTTCRLQESHRQRYVTNNFPRRPVITTWKRYRNHDPARVRSWKINIPALLRRQKLLSSVINSSFGRLNMDMLPCWRDIDMLLTFSYPIVIRNETPSFISTMKPLVGKYISLSWAWFGRIWERQIDVRASLEGQICVSDLSERTLICFWPLYIA